MEGVKNVKKIDDQRLYRKAGFSGKTTARDAAIFARFPAQRIVWRSMGGAKNSASVEFTALGAKETYVGPLMEFHGRNVSKLLRDVGDWA
jgi:uncharacterized membrane protein